MAFSILTNNNSWGNNWAGKAGAAALVASAALFADDATVVGVVDDPIAALAGVGGLALIALSFASGCGGKGSVGINQAPADVPQDSGTIDARDAVDSSPPFDASNADGPHPPDAGVCLCGNYLLSSSNACPPLPPTSLNQKIEAILAYESMRDVQLLADSDCRIRQILSGLLQAYDPCLPLDSLEAKFDQALNVLALPPFCSAFTPGIDRITNEFIKNLVNALYIEISGSVTWSLAQYSRDQIQFLLPTRPCEQNPLPDPDFLMVNSGITVGCGLNKEERAPYQVLPLSLSDVLPDQRETAAKVIQLVADLFFHAYSSPSRGENWDADTYRPGDWVATCESGNPKEFYNYLPPVPLFRERVLESGCHSAAMLAATYLRAINIPAQELLYAHIYNNDASAKEWHGALWLPSLGLFSHGDWLAGFAGRDGNVLLYPWPDFLIAAWQGGANGGSGPAGIPNAFIGVSLLRNAPEGMLYLKGTFATIPMGDYFPVQGFVGDINQPLPQFTNMLEELKRFHSNVKVFVDPERAPGVALASDPAPPASLDDLRQQMCAK